MRGYLGLWCRAVVAVGVGGYGGMAVLVYEVILLYTDGISTKPCISVSAQARALHLSPLGSSSECAYPGAQG